MNPHEARSLTDEQAALIFTTNALERLAHATIVERAEERDLAGNVVGVLASMRNGGETLIKFRFIVTRQGLEALQLEAEKPEATDGPSPQDEPPPVPEEPEDATSHDWPEPDESGKYPDLEAAKAKIREEAEAEQQAKETKRQLRKEADRLLVAKIVQTLEPLTEIEFLAGLKRIAAEFGVPQSLVKKLWKQVLEQRVKSNLRKQTDAPDRGPLTRSSEYASELIPGVRPLGFDRNVFYLYSARTREIVAITSTQCGERALQTVASFEAWQKAFPARGGIDTAMAWEWIVGICSRVGKFHEAAVKGRGAWRIGAKLIFHAGDRLVDPDTGNETPLADQSSAIVFESGRRIELAKDPATASDGAAVLDLLSGPNWAVPMSAHLLAGWLFLAPVCGALDYRPGTLIKGPTSTGKSVTIERVVDPILGEHEVTFLRIQGASTEAGLRQSLGRDAIPTRWDEAEADNQARAQKLEAIQFLLRQTSSTSGEVVKGTSTGRRQSFSPKTMLLQASTVEYYGQEADANRVTTLELVRDNNKKDAFKTFRSKADALLTSEFCLRIRTRSVRMLRNLIAAIELFRDEATDVLGSTRAGDQLGTLAAGAWMLAHDDIPSAEAAKHYVEQLAGNEQRTETLRMSDSRRCLAEIIGSTVRVGNKDISVWELILSHYAPDKVATLFLSDEADAAEQALGEKPSQILVRYGIKLAPVEVDGERTPCVWFAADHPKLRNLAGSFAHIYGQRLKELAESPSRNQWFVGRTIRAIPILFGKIAELSGKVDET